MWCIYTMEYHSATKRNEFSHCSNTDRTGDYHVE
jgi:hypothetical protein